MNAGAEISLRIGQRVRHQDFKGQRVTGLVTALALNGRELMVDVALDAPIVFPADKYGPELTIRHQHAPAHEYQPFDEREELIAELVKALDEAAQSLQTIAKNAGKARDTDGLENYLQGFDQVRGYAGSRAGAARAAIAKAAGGAA